MLGWLQRMADRNPVTMMVGGKGFELNGSGVLVTAGENRGVYWNWSHRCLSVDFLGRDFRL
jgi:hypothetical protein